VDSEEAHKKWIPDINETQDCLVDYPIIADEDKSVSIAYGMFQPLANDKLTVRSVFFIDPGKKIRAMITYPASTGRNFQEILRVLDSLQLTDGYKVATPVNWKDGEDVVIAPAIQDPEELKTRFPKGYKVIKPYLRLTPQPNK
jgi:alkyl hydroperoxide reductase subunit AhpC